MNEHLIARLRNFGFTFGSERAKSMTWKAGDLFGVTIEVEVRSVHYKTGDVTYVEPVYGVHLPHSCDEWEIAYAEPSAAGASAVVIGMLEELIHAQRMLAKIQEVTQ